MKFHGRGSGLFLVLWPFSVFFTSSSFSSAMSKPRSRPLGGTELSWCRAVPGGTGITVLALLLSHRPDPSVLENALHKLQNHHPILRSKLSHINTSNPSISIPLSPSLRLQSLDPPSNLLRSPTPLPVSSFHLLLEQELNQNPWSQIDKHPHFDVFFATLYSLPDSRHVLAIRLHTSVCDRTAAVTLSKELLGLMREGQGGVKWVLGNGGGNEVPLPIEELVPKGKGDKPFWSRGVDLVGYSLNSLRLSNLDFGDICARRRSEVVRLQLSREETDRLLAVSH